MRRARRAALAPRRRRPADCGAAIARAGGLLLLTLAVAVLGACYASNQLLLDPEAAADPFADGVYERQDAGRQRYQLTREPDGWYDVEAFNPNGSLGETRRVLFNPLPLGAVKAFAAAEASDDGFVYGVALQQGERVFLATPNCADPLDASVAVDQGGEAEDDDAMTHNCLFRDRDAVMAALATYAGQADFGAPYVRK